MCGALTRPELPSRHGETSSNASSHNPAAMNSFRSFAPPSTRSELMPSSLKSLCRVSSSGSQVLICRVFSEVSANSRHCCAEARPCLSNIIGRGDFPSIMRTSRRGLSAMAVVAPTAMASCVARRQCTSCELSLVENRAAVSPDCRLMSMKPSALRAHLSVTNGRPRVCAVMNVLFSSRDSSASSPSSTCMPACRSIAMPRPDTLGFGSPAATTTRPMPMSANSLAHGGVLP